MKTLYKTSPFWTHFCREGIPEDRLHTLADLAEVDRKHLCAELTAFVEHFDGIVNREIRSNDTISYTHEADKEIPCVSGLCQKCLPCVLLLLHKYNLHCISFTNLYVAYKVVLSLPRTQVKCESFFKTQNYKKNRLRSMLGQENLDSLMIINVERDINYCLSE